MSNRMPSLRVVFGRLVFAAAPLACAPAGNLDPGSCQNSCYKAFPSGSTTVAVPDGGVSAEPLTSLQCEEEYCPTGVGWSHCEAADGGQAVECFCEQCFYVGRAPAGLKPMTLESATVLGRFLAASAHLEAAAVIAFRGLAQEASGFGAPATLVRSLEAAAADEIRHARSMGRLARRHGARTPPVEVEDAGDRTLFALALENASEGCVNETHAALVATWQAQAASDPAIRRAMRIIARDETRHAEVSWAVARWAHERLSPEQRVAVGAARSEALAKLEHAAKHAQEPELIRATGLPPRAVAEHLVRGLATAVQERGRALDA